MTVTTGALVRVAEFRGDGDGDVVDRARTWWGSGFVGVLGSGGFFVLGFLSIFGGQSCQ